MEKNEIEIMHSKANMISYGFGDFINQFMAMAFGVYSYFYYETEIGLDSLLCGLAFILYAVWNAVNDPLIGYLVDRPFKFTKKWGRRFPWVYIGGIPWIISYILIFTPPDVDPQTGAWILFAWLLFTICLFDTFASICLVNYYSLFPDKYRSVEERRTLTGLNIPVGVLGVLLGAVVPPLFISFGNLQSYIIQAGAVFVVCVIALLIAIPGCREDQIIVDRYLANYEEKIETESFFKSFKSSLEQKAFVAYILFYFCYQVMIKSMTASISYAVRFILNMEAIAISLIMGAFLIGVILGLPFWVKLAHKTNNNSKVMIISGILMTISVAPLLFVRDYILITITMFVWGLSQGGFWAMLNPVFADVIDESVVKTGKREEGLYNGFQTFFARLAFAAQAISFAVIHTLTGFQEGASTQSETAIWGIHMHLALIPMIFMIVGLIIFKKLYDLTPNKVNENQLKIRQLKL
jgi:GPH family glycoside/pentoside/hexuronide:cation symporter